MAVRFTRKLAREVYYMAGGLGTGLFVTGHCFCCLFISFEEIDVPQRPGGKPYKKPTKKAVREIVDEAREKLAEEHQREGCKVKLTFGFVVTHPYRQNLAGISATACWAEKIINR